MDFDKLIADTSRWTSTSIYARRGFRDLSRASTVTIDDKAERRAVCASLADRWIAVGKRLASKHADTAKMAIKLAGLIRDGKRFDARADHPCAAKVWRDLEPETRLVATVGLDRADGTRAGKTVEERVVEYAARWESGGKGLATLTRDGIASALRVSSGAVSRTQTWKRIARLKRQGKLPDTSEDAAIKAAEAGDWDAVESLQREEARRNRQHH